MDGFARVRRTSLQVAKLQRRIWLVQTVVAPAVAIGGVVIAIAVGTWAWQRRSTRPPAVAVTPAIAAEPVDAGVNSAVNGNHSG